MGKYSEYDIYLLQDKFSLESWLLVFGLGFFFCWAVHRVLSHITVWSVSDSKSFPFGILKWIWQMMVQAHFLLWHSFKLFIILNMKVAWWCYDLPLDKTASSSESNCSNWLSCRCLNSDTGHLLMHFNISCVFFTGSGISDLGRMLVWRSIVSATLPLNILG